MDGKARGGGGGVTFISLLVNLWRNGKLVLPYVCLYLGL